MSMKVQNRQVDGVTILDLSGRITLGEGMIAEPPRSTRVGDAIAKCKAQSFVASRDSRKIVADRRNSDMLGPWQSCATS